MHSHRTQFLTLHIALIETRQLGATAVMSEAVDTKPNPNDSHIEVRNYELEFSPLLKQNQHKMQPDKDASMFTKPEGDTALDSNDGRVEFESNGQKADPRGKTNPYTHPVPEDQPKMWKAGEPYHYALPKPEGDCWSLILAEKLKGDTIKCNAWKEEVQNLLIFAGLFSAVVTTFIIESYKNLRPDPNDTIIFLLNRIANNEGPITPPTFTRPASTIRINVCWFLSLIFSLATVLVGIISLQWLREHQRYTDEITQRKSVSVFHMRVQGLDAWYVPQVFTGLPLLLQSALIIFLLGVIDFLFALDFVVAIPVTVGIVLVLVFLIATTVLPTLQLLIPRKLDLQNRPDETQIPIQCPYRSPQAWIFYQFASIVYKTLKRFRLASSHIINEKSTLFPFRCALSSSKNHQFKSWVSFDSWWLTIPEVYMTRPDAHRDPYNPHMTNSESLSKVVDMEPTRATLPMYIEAESLIETLKRYSSNHATACALYHCVQEVSFGGMNNQGLGTLRFANALFDLYYTQRTPVINYHGSSLFSYFAPSDQALPNIDLFGQPESIIQDEQMIWFLGALQHYGYPQSLKTDFASHLLELVLRLIGYLSTKNRMVLPVHQMRAAYLILDDFPYFEYKFLQFIPNEVEEASVTQFYLVFDSFIHQVAEVTKDTLLLPGTTYNDPAFMKSICSIPSRLLGTQIQKAESGLPEIFKKTIHFMSVTLYGAVEQHRPCPLLFLTASYIVTKIFRSFGISRLIPVRKRLEMFQTGFRKWNYDPVHSKPILSLVDASSKYYYHFKPMNEDPFSGTDRYKRKHICVWHVTPTFELSSVEVPTRPRQYDPPSSRVAEEDSTH